jgi:hypothetical protein
MSLEKADRKALADRRPETVWRLHTVGAGRVGGQGEHEWQRWGWHPQNCHCQVVLGCKPVTLYEICPDQAI